MQCASFFGIESDARVRDLDDDRDFRARWATERGSATCPELLTHGLAACRGGTAVSYLGPFGAGRVVFGGVLFQHPVSTGMGLAEGGFHVSHRHVGVDFRGGDGSVAEGELADALRRCRLRQPASRSEAEGGDGKRVREEIRTQPEQSPRFSHDLPNGIAVWVLARWPSANRERVVRPAGCLAAAASGSDYRSRSRQTSPRRKPVADAGLCP